MRAKTRLFINGKEVEHRFYRNKRQIIKDFMDDTVTVIFKLPMGTLDLSVFHIRLDTIHKDKITTLQGIGVIDQFTVVESENEEVVTIIIAEPDIFEEIIE